MLVGSYLLVLLVLLASYWGFSQAIAIGLIVAILYQGVRSQNPAILAFAFAVGLTADLVNLTRIGLTSTLLLVVSASIFLVLKKAEMAVYGWFIMISLFTYSVYQVSILKSSIHFSNLVLVLLVAVMAQFIISQFLTPSTIQIKQPR